MMKSVKSEVYPKPYDACPHLSTPGSFRVERYLKLKIRINIIINLSTPISIPVASNNVKEFIAWNLTNEK